MSLPQIANLEAYRGDSWSQQFKLYSAPGTLLDLTGATVTAKALSNDGTSITLTVAVTNPGIVTIYLPTGVEAGIYWYDLQVVISTVVTTWVRGQLSITQDVTP